MTKNGKKTISGKKRKKTVHVAKLGGRSVLHLKKNKKKVPNSIKKVKKNQ